MSRLVFNLIPHTHWDREWYEPEPVFRTRLVAMLDDLLPRLESGTMEQFTLDGQAVLLADYLAVRPEREALVATLVRSGRLEVGPWYILADEQVVSAESLIRNLIEGRRLAERLGRNSSMIYSPDAFGHPAFLPDLAREFGLERAVLWRGWGGTQDAFQWTGPAGGRLFVYHLPSQGYEMGAHLLPSPDLPAAWKALRAQLVARSSSPHVAVFVGADHHWAHRDVALLRRALGSLEPGNEVRLARVDEFLSSHARLAQAAPEVTGELREGYGYTWVLQGTHSARAPHKRRNAELELALERLASPLAALAGGDAVRALLANAWRRLLENHFHDSICGTVSDGVALAMLERFREIEGAGRELTRRAMWRIVGHDPGQARAASAVLRPRLVLWNPVPRRRAGIIYARVTGFRRDVLVGPPGEGTPRTGSGGPPTSLVTPSGGHFPMQVLVSGTATERLDADHHYPDLDEVDIASVAFEAPPMPGFGWAEFEGGHAILSAPASAMASADRLDNGLVSLAVGRDGRISVESHAAGKMDGLLELVGATDTGDTYTMNLVGAERALQRLTPVVTKVLAPGPLVGAIEATWSVRAGASPGNPRAPGSVAVRLVILLEKGSPIVRCRLELDNQAAGHRLRLALPLGFAGGSWLAGTQMGVVTREAVAPVQAAVDMEARVDTVPAHRFAAAAHGTGGLAFLAPGFFEAEALGGRLMVTVLRAVGMLSRNDLPTRPGHAAWPVATPLAQCPGTTRMGFALALLDESGLRRPDHLHALWEDAFLPIQPWWLRDATGSACPGDTLELEGEGLVLSIVKPAEDGSGMVIRIVNLTDRQQEGRLRFHAPRTSVQRIRADERQGRPVDLGDGGRVIAFQAGPRGMATFLAF